MTSSANKKESKAKAINRYISLSDWKGISLQFNKKKVWFSFQRPGSNSNKSLCRDKSIIQQINILIKNMSYAPEKLDFNKIKESMSDRQWAYLKPGVIAGFVKNYNSEIKQHVMMPSSAPMDKQKPSNQTSSFTNHNEYQSEYDDDDIDYTRPPNEYYHDHDDYPSSIKNEHHHHHEQQSMYASSHEQEQDGLPSYPMEQHYGLPSEVATFGDETQDHHQYVDNSDHNHNQFNLSPVPIQDPSNAITDPSFIRTKEDEDNDIDLLPTTLPTEHMIHESTATEYGHAPYSTEPPQTFAYPDNTTTAASYSYPPPKGSEYTHDYVMPPATSHYYDPLKMAMDSSHAVKYPMYPMSMQSAYPSSAYAAYAAMYQQQYMMMTPPSPKNVYVSKEDEKDYKEWLQEKNLKYDNYKIQMDKMRKYFEHRVKKAIENEGLWKKKYEDLLTKYTMQQSEIGSMNASNHNNIDHNKSPNTSSSSQFSAAAAIGDLNISDGSTSKRRKKRRLDVCEDNNEQDLFMTMKQQSPPKRFKMDHDYVGNSSGSYSSDNVTLSDHVMVNNDNIDSFRHFEDGFETNNQSIF